MLIIKIFLDLCENSIFKTSFIRKFSKKDCTLRCSNKKQLGTIKKEKKKDMYNWKFFLLDDTIARYDAITQAKKWHHTAQTFKMYQDSFKMYQDLKQKKQKMRVQTHLSCDEKMKTRIDLRKTTYYIYTHTVCPLCIKKDTFCNVSLP